MTRKRHKVRRQQRERQGRAERAAPRARRPRANRGGPSLVGKSARELRLMRRAGLLVWEAHRRVAELVRPGVTTGELDAMVERLFAEHQAVPLFLNYPGAVPFPAVTCISVNEEIVHGIPGDRVLRSGDIVGVDTGCRLDGWCGDAAVTHAVGDVSDEARRLIDVTRGVLDLAIELLAVKSRWSEVAGQMSAYVHDHGFSVVDEFVGHGIGREMHEDPQIPNFTTPEFRKTGDFRLTEGLTLAIEPMINVGTKDVKVLADRWTAVTADGKLSAHFEHTVALTRDGPRLLTGPPEEGEEVDWLTAKGEIPMSGSERTEQTSNCAFRT
jgi:methionyl aminopeptidase